MKKTRKILSVVLSLALILALVPASLVGAVPAPDDISVEDVGTLHKQVVERTGDDSWKINLSVDADAAIHTEPVEVAIVLDCSGSMSWCTHPEWHHAHDSSCTSCVDSHIHTDDCYTCEAKTNAHNEPWNGGDPCPPEYGESRIDAMVRATKELIQTLVDNRVDARISLTGFSSNDYTRIQLPQTNILNAEGEIDDNAVKFLMDNIPNVAYGGTNVKMGLDDGFDSFSNDDSIKKVIVMMTDGEHNMTGEATEDQVIEKATEIKDTGAIIYSVGFLLDDTLLSDIATDGCYSTAKDGADLSSVFQVIAAQISAMVYDQMGDYFDYVDGSMQVKGGTSIVPGVTSDVMTWTPEGNLLAPGVKAEFEYKVQLDWSKVLKGGKYEQETNKSAVLTYAVGEGSTQNENFPHPTVTFEVGVLENSFAGLPAALTANGATYATETSKLITDNGAKTFEFTAPPAKIIHDGVVYFYQGTSYEVEDGAVKGTPDLVDGKLAATTGTHKITHNYAAFPATVLIEKYFTDDDGNGVAGTFQFKVNDETVSVTTNENGYGSFLYTVPEFDEDFDGDQIVLEISEIVPEGATDNVLNGIFYDDTVYTVTLDLSVGSTVYKNGLEMAQEDGRVVFSNLALEKIDEENPPLNPPPTDDLTKIPDSETPKTGNSFALGLTTSILFVSVLGAFILRKKRRKNQI